MQLWYNGVNCACTHVKWLLLEQKMSLLQYLKPSNTLPTSEQTGGHITISETWALSLLKRMGYVKCKATTKSIHLQYLVKYLSKPKNRFLRQITRMVKLREIPDNLIINLDQTGIHLVPTGDWTMVHFFWTWHL